jgi:cellulose synthase/poly-beta-1,6-N-acetylglucosamine synthase-like glycosyltransferase
MKGFPVDDAVTAVVPAYNAEATLDETLRSVRAQTHREILVVDDGSREARPHDRACRRGRPVGAG